MDEHPLCATRTKGVHKVHLTAHILPLAHPQKFLPCGKCHGKTCLKTWLIAASQKKICFRDGIIYEIMGIFLRIWDYFKIIVILFVNVYEIINVNHLEICVRDYGINERLGDYSYN